MLFFISLAFLAVVAVIVAFRLFGDEGTRLIAGSPASVQGGPSAGYSDYMSHRAVEERYRELVELGMIQLEPNEEIAIGCGRRGDHEEVVLVSNKRVFVLTRRTGATFFAKQIYYLGDLRPVPSSAGLMGNKFIVTDGTQTSAVDSPGDQGFLESAQKVVRELNRRVREAQHALGK